MKPVAGETVIFSPFHRFTGSPTLSIVTRQPAIQIRLLFLMAFDTESHLEICSSNSIHLLDSAVTLLTGHFLFNMALVIEHDMLGQIVCLDPRSGRIGIKIPMFLQNLWVFGNDVIVAIQTFFHRWNSRMDGSADIRVAKLALNFFYAGMQAVAERYGLLRANVSARWYVKIIEKPCGQKHTDSCQYAGFHIAR